MRRLSVGITAPTEACAGAPVDAPAHCTAPEAHAEAGTKAASETMAAAGQA